MSQPALSQECGDVIQGLGARITALSPTAMRSSSRAHSVFAGQLRPRETLGTPAKSFVVVGESERDVIGTQAGGPVQHREN